MRTIGQNIKEIRKEKGISQNELAKKLNISQAAISQFEKNLSSPKMDTIKKIADALEVPYFHLIDLKLNDNSLFSYDSTIAKNNDTIVDDLDKYITNNFKSRGIDGIIKKLEKIGWTVKPDIYNTNHTRFLTDKKVDVALSDKELISLDIETDEYIKFKVNSLINHNSHSTKE